METQETVIDNETGLTIAEPKFAEVMVREDSAVFLPPTPHVVPSEDLPDFDEMDEGFSLAAKYREFETAGEKVRALFVGFTTMQNQQGKVIPVAMFQNKEGVFVNAGANLVSQVRQLPAGTAVQVTYQGKERTKTGNNVKVFDVRLLNARQVPQPESPKREPTPTELPIPPEVASFNPGNGVQVHSKTNGKGKPPFHLVGRAFELWNDLKEFAKVNGYALDAEGNVVDWHLAEGIRHGGFDPADNKLRMMNRDEVIAALRKRITEKKGEVIDYEIATT